MSKKSKKSRARAQRFRNGFGRGLASNSPSVVDKSVVSREFPSSTALAIGVFDFDAIGSFNWATVLTGHVDWPEMSNLYRQCRLVSVTVRITPSQFYATNITGSVSDWVDTHGVVAHDPTSQVSTSVTSAQFQQLPGSQVWSSRSKATRTGFSTIRWKAPRVKTMNFGNNTLTTTPGEWISTAYAGNLAGQTLFSAITQGGYTNGDAAQQVLTVYVQIVVQFRQPMPTSSTSSLIELKYAERDHTAWPLDSQEKEEKKVPVHTGQLKESDPSPPSLMKPVLKRAK